jgi:hypothetical protein
MQVQYGLPGIASVTDSPLVSPMRAIHVDKNKRGKRHKGGKQRDEGGADLDLGLSFPFSLPWQSVCVCPYIVRNTSLSILFNVSTRGSEVLYHPSAERCWRPRPRSRDWGAPQIERPAACSVFTRSVKQSHEGHERARERSLGREAPLSTRPQKACGGPSVWEAFAPWCPGHMQLRTY